MQKYRVYELAKMLGKTNEEIITTLQKNNINVKTNFNSVGEKEKELREILSLSSCFLIIFIVVIITVWSIFITYCWIII